MATIGFIGLGNMGGPMAANLVTAGHQVVGFDVSEQARAQALQAGVTLADTVKEAVVDVDVVITMLPTGQHVREVVLGEDGVASHVSPAALVIDSSTIDVASTRDVHEAMEARGLSFVDAPVSGGVSKASAGTLTFMVGGSDGAFAAAQPYLEVMGANIVHVGAGGAGQGAKICNNMLFGTTLVATAESFALAEKLGLDPQKIFGIITSSSGDNWGVRNFCPVPGVVDGSAADDGYAARFAAALMSKDLRLALEAADASGVELPVSGRANEVFADLASTEGHLDASAVIHAVRGRS